MTFVSQSTKEDQQESPIFIVGMPRSGTTLISRILSSHSQISIAPESHFLNYWMQRFSASLLQDEENFQKFWQVFIHSERFGYFECQPSKLISQIQSTDSNKARSLFSNLLKQYAKKTNKSRWGEKTPVHYAHIYRLLNWYPNARIIYMVRDPRAVAASMQKVPWGGNRIIAYALRWKDSIEHLEKWREDSRVKYVKYEQLVSNSSATLDNICQFIGEDFQYQMLMSEMIPSEHFSKLYSSEWAVSHLTAAATPINRYSLDKWQEELSNKQIALVEYLTQKSMGKFGYRPSGFSLGLTDKINAELYIFAKDLKTRINRKALGQRFLPAWA